MEKLKLKLQLETLWKYFTKIECEIILIAARMELSGDWRVILVVNRIFYQQTQTTAKSTDS
jgi:hypothetical protein